MDTGTLDGEIAHQLIFFLRLFLIGNIQFLNFCNSRTDIRQNEELIVIHVLGDEFESLFRQLDRVMLFINDEIQFGIHLVHFLVLILHVIVLRFLENLLHTRLTQILDQCLVLRQRPITPKQGHSTLTFFVAVLSFRN